MIAVDHSYTGGIVAAIFKLSKTVDDQRHD